MTSTRSPSLALTLARAGVGFMWWTAIAAILAMGVFSLPGLADDSRFIISGEVEVGAMPLNPDGTIGGVSAMGPRQGNEAEIGDFRATLEFTPSTVGSWALWSAPILVFLTLAMFALHQVRALLKAVAIDEVFSLANASRVSRLGWTLLGVAVLIKPMMWWTSFMAIRELGSSNQGLRPMLDTDGWMTAIVAALVVVVLGQIWRHGAELERDRQLTV